MNTSLPKKDRVEVGSDQLKAELIEIKERVGALETIASISNRDVVEKFVRAHITSPQGRAIMRECQEPRTKKYLQEKLNLKTGQALDYHLTPLREANLLQRQWDEEGVLRFEWSNLFKGLPTKTVKQVLADKR